MSAEVQTFDGMVTARTRLTPDIWRIRLALPAGQGFPFRAGQFARLALGPFPPRDYSMANAPGDGELEFHIRRMNDDGASAYAAERLRVGDVVGVDGPHGEAYLREDHGGPILAVAGGSGLAPMKSIVERALAIGLTQSIRLYLGARHAADIYLEEHFSALQAAHANFTFVALVVDAPPGRGRRRGTPDRALAKDVAEEAAHLAGAKAYLAGPPAMVEAAAARLRALGLPAADIHADPFYSAAEMVARGLRGGGGTEAVDS